MSCYAMQRPLRARFEIMERRPGALYIRDLGPWHKYMTVTNDAEAVVEVLLRMGDLKSGMRLFYYDSEDELDEITFNEHGFTGFRPGPRPAMEIR